MITLNPDQQAAKEFFQRWWDSDKRFAILEGCAGTGKTTIVSQLVAGLKDCDPLFTAPTNEACKQLENVLPKDSLIKTIYSALGFHFETSSEVRTLTQKAKEPPVINDINLLIIDECSMVGQTLLEAILDANKKTLFIGHRSQLPEVIKDLSIYDDCESVVFKQEWPIYTLTTPERNKGELFEFINTLETIIYNKPRSFKSTYNKSIAYMEEYIESKEGRHDLLYEKSKVICWSNAEVDRFNNFIRQAIFKEDVLPPFVLKDKIIMLEPCVYVEPLAGLSKGVISKFMDSSKVARFSANTKGIVRKIEQVVVLSVPCWELEVEIDRMRPLIYVPVNVGILETLRKKLMNECYAAVTIKAKEKAFRRYHFILSLFAKVKHSYAITTHRSQGMTIPNVYVSWRDIKKCDNVVMRHKLLYVAASRAKDNLTILA